LSRVVIEAIEPEVDGARFPVKRTLGEEVRVQADVFADGHDRLAGVLRYRLTEAPLETGALAEDRDWHEVAIESLGNDRFGASFTVRALGRYEYTVQAWIDRFASWRDLVSRKHAAGQSMHGELLEGADLIRQTAHHLRGGPRSGDGGVLVQAPPGSALLPREPGDDPRPWLLRQADLLASDLPEPERMAIALSPRLSTVMTRFADRRDATTYDRTPAVQVERERARYGAWYEMFPRSAGPDPTRPATFDEAARRLPDVAALGFDVVYLPPVHPIGRSFRKGRNNALVAGPGDPGSPWAIGATEGGHTAVDPGLGGIDAFDRFVAIAGHLGLEIALDLALQASPDHPLVAAHPEWFHRRADGRIRYAENPPKKYQDIYPFDFEARDWRGLWHEMLRVALFWIDHGVLIFRVDNPHTKPFRFWQWLIAEVRHRHPDAVFLSEAFTRPKVMRHLAKVGFSQSYSYFTWRNTKAELEAYFTELTQSDVRQYMRVNLFANTPDILPEYLQRGGRPAFQVRLILAATLGASYGIYSGFELCENLAIAGTEEYVDSEKYQILVRDWDRPGNIRELVARVNQIRRENPALHGDWSLAFHQTDNADLIAYSKRTEDGSNTILTVVNLDPVNTQHGWLRVPLRDWRVTPGQALVVHDLLTDERFEWRTEWNYVRLEPGVRPAHIFRVVVRR
jgi:starch synthase (maltosyl-transferring)